MSESPKLPNLPSILASKVAASERWVVMTGSGVSAESGVPTFRDAQTGLWSKYNAEELATSQAFEANPTLVWGWYTWRRELIKKAEPNAAHRALVTLAQLKPGLSLVTQNVDGLHQRAGNDNVVEFHENIRPKKYFSCNRPTETPEKPKSGRHDVKSATVFSVLTSYGSVRLYQKRSSPSHFSLLSILRSFYRWELPPSSTR